MSIIFFSCYLTRIKEEEKKLFQFEGKKTVEKHNNFNCVKLKPTTSSYQSVHTSLLQYI